MVQIDLPMCAGVGSLLAHGAREQLRTRTAAGYWRPFAALLLFMGLANNWAPLWLLTHYFGFQTSHMWWHADSVAAYPNFIWLFTILLNLSAVLGFELGCRLIRGGHEGWNRAFCAGMFFFAGLWSFGLGRRTATLGTYSEWVAGTSPMWFTDRRYMTMVAIAMVVWFGSLIPLYRWLRREGQGVHG